MLCLKQKFERLTDIRNKSDLIDLAHSLGSVYIQKDDKHGHGIVTLRYDTSIPKYGFSNTALFPHTDRSNMKFPPDIVILWCEKNATFGGDSLIFDADKHLMPIIHEVNFFADFSSENDRKTIRAPFYSMEKDMFRFRNDAFISLSDESTRQFERVKSIIQHHTRRIKLREKECLVLDNHKVFHGRDEFEGDRVMHRVLIYKDSE